MRLIDSLGNNVQLAISNLRLKDCFVSQADFLAMMKRLVMALMAIGITVGVNAQDDPLEDLKLINLTYAKATSYSTEVEVEMKDDDGELIMTQYGFAIKSEDGYLRGFNGNVSLINEDCMVVVVHPYEQIIYNINRAGLNTEDGMGADELEAMAEELIGSSGASYRFLNLGATSRTIEVTNLGGNYEKITISYDPVTYQFSSISYYFTAQEGQAYSQVHIAYTRMEVNEDIDPDVFDETQYISKKGKEISPAAAYADYTLVDQTKIQLPNE